MIVLLVIVFLLFAVALSWPARYCLPVALGLLAYSGLQQDYNVVMAALWAGYIIAAVLILVRPIRIACVSRPLSAWVRSRLPKVSVAEQVVLDAGGTWWETRLFAGTVGWRSLLKQKMSILTEAEQSFIDNQVETLCGMLNEWEINHQSKDLPAAAWEYIKRERFWALCMEPSHGGLGFSHLAHSAIITKIATCSISAAYTVMVPNSLGPAELIAYAGTEEQKSHYLPRLACGEEIGCFGLTSLHAGSDAASIPDRGRVGMGLHQGEEVLGIYLSFAKRYITLAPMSTLIGLAIHLYDPDSFLGGGEDVGITVVLLPGEHPGVTVGRRHSPMTLGFMNGPITGDDVFIPLDWVIGGAANCGAGWEMLMGCLSVGRGISMPALSSAIAAQCCAFAGSYSVIRRQFKRAVVEFEGVSEALAKVAGLSYLIQATRISLAEASCQGARPSVAAAIAKYHLTEQSRQILQHTMDIHSGHALQAGPHNLLAEVYSGMPISTVGEGANIMTRSLIIFGQGLLRAHPVLRDEIMAATAAADSPAALYQFDRLFFKHVGLTCRGLVRGFFYAIGGRVLISAPRSPLRGEMRRISRLANALTVFSDIAMLTLGKKLKERESLSARLGDVFSYLLLAMNVVKLFHDRGAEDSERAFAHWSINYCLYHAVNALRQFIDNFPARIRVRCVKALLFPLGIKSPYPRDSLNASLVDGVAKPGAVRDFLTEHCFTGNASDSLGRVVTAWQAVLEAEPLYSIVNAAIKSGQLDRQPTRQETFNLARAQGILSCSEHTQIMRAEQLRDAALTVDEFAFDGLVGFNAGVLQQSEAIE